MASDKKLHVVMFPWLAFGHVTPFLNLSKFIAQKGHKITFISTPRIIDRLPNISQDLSSLITLVKIPLPRIPELPENAQATADIKNEDMNYLKKAFDGLELELTRFLEDSRPDWIIYDFAPHWLPPVTTRLGISGAFFLIINAWFLALFGPLDSLINGSDYRTTPEDFMVPPKWVKFKTKVAYRRFEANWMLQATQKNVLLVSDAYRVGKVIEGSEAIIVRHCYEFEPDWLELLHELYKKPVVPVGLMPPRGQEILHDENLETWGPVKNWLDNQHKGSVVYVALGSEVNLTQEQLGELALGLELSEVPFFWVLRDSSGSSDTNSVGLPSQFESRVVEGGRGVVWRGWAPQVKILSHDSVGGFLTHCGWSSIVEGLMFGRTLITLPFLVDQGLNSRVIVDKRVGVEILRNEHDGSYTKESVAESVKLVMVDDDGVKYRESAKEISVVFKNEELHMGYIDKFIEFIEGHRSMSR